ncbi:MAG TPA: inositol monophosphatase family protein, partial [Actinomycetota bacterium]|nr:inositol monophosphatase family protein [Actinomycetota bacterium]
MTSSGVGERLRWAERVAGEVGELLLGSFRTGVVAERKDRGVVTELDRRAEGLIARSLKESFPEDGLLAEEGTGREGRSGWRWVVDPLDGTTNYVSGLPMFAVSLACLDGPLERGGVVLGVVRAPALGESFRAVRGAGGPEATAAGGGPEALSDAVFIVNKAYAPAAMLWDVAGGLMQSVRAFRTFG